MSKNNLKNKALTLRKKGYSFKEISLVLNISKSSCSIWCKNLTLSNRAKKRLEKLLLTGQRRGQLKNRQKAQARFLEINNSVKLELSNLILPSTFLKLLCSMLYWGEGSKNQHRVAFTNSDPLMVKFFLTLFRKCFLPDENRFQASLHLHSYHDRNTMLNFWSKITNIAKEKISVYNKESAGLFKKEGYKGCISIRYNDASIYRRLEAYYTIFARNMGV